MQIRVHNVRQRIFQNFCPVGGILTDKLSVVASEPTRLPASVKVEVVNQVAFDLKRQERSVWSRRNSKASSE